MQFTCNFVHWMKMRLKWLDSGAIQRSRAINNGTLRLISGTKWTNCLAEWTAI